MTRRSRPQSVRPRRFPGQNLVEFALVSVLLLMGIFGVVDLGRAVYARTTLTNAVREAARYGATNPPSSNTDSSAISGMKNAAQSHSSGLALQTDPNFTAGWMGGTVQCSQWSGGARPAVGAPQGWLPRALHLP